MADDWQCSETGPVNDIHFWTSWAQDDVGVIRDITATIYDNSNAGTFPRPGAPLWAHTFGAGEFTVVNPAGQGDQGFADPQQGPNSWGFNDHTQYQQINIENIDQVFADPFLQIEGETYWLGLWVDYPAGSIQSPVGWKTTTDQLEFQSTAVYRNLGTWNLLDVPNTPLSVGRLDMAFVITPEPASGLLLAIGIVLLCKAASARKELKTLVNDDQSPTAAGSGGDCASSTCSWLRSA